MNRPWLGDALTQAPTETAIPTGIYLAFSVPACLFCSFVAGHNINVRLYDFAGFWVALAAMAYAFYVYAVRRTLRRGV